MSHLTYQDTNRQTLQHVVENFQQLFLINIDIKF